MDVAVTLGCAVRLSLSAWPNVVRYHLEFQHDLTVYTSELSYVSMHYKLSFLDVLESDHQVIELLVAASHALDQIPEFQSLIFLFDDVAYT